MKRGVVIIPTARHSAEPLPVTIVAPPHIPGSVSQTSATPELNKTVDKPVQYTDSKSTQHTNSGQGKQMIIPRPNQQSAQQSNTPALPQLPQLPGLPQFPGLPQLPFPKGLSQPQFTDAALQGVAADAVGMGAQKASGVALDVARTFPDPRNIPSVLALNGVNSAAVLPIEVIKLAVETALLSLKTGPKV